MIVDLFAGGGGASRGIEAALGRSPDVAVNHSPVALAIHADNHPRTLHLAADVWEVDPRETTRGRAVDLLWASPDCTHHSRAKGGVPRDSGLRSLAWVVRDWARDVRPRVIIVENVPEFISWGPLGEDGQPVAERKGETFRQWVGALELLGYRVEWRVLAACDYGAPTSRRRLFVVASCDGPPVWPEPTHGPGLLPHRSAAECIDWSIPVPPIMGRARPLADSTQRRIAAGLRRFVRDLSQPYRPDASRSVWAWITAYYGAAHEAGQDLREPLRTIVGVDRFGLCTVDGAGAIGLRMLHPHELLRAQFGEYAEGYSLDAAPTARARTKAIGNSVAPAVAAALVRAQFPGAMREAS